MRISDEPCGIEISNRFVSGFFVRPGEDMEVAGLAAVPMRFHRGDLGRLVLERVEAVLVADEQLQRRQHRGRPIAMRSMVRASSMCLPPSR